MQPSEFFFRLKRGCIIASIVVILSRVVGIGLNEQAQFLIFKLRDAPSNVIPIVAEAVCIYFFVYFLTVYLSESQNFRSDKDGLRSLAKLKEDLDHTFAAIGKETGRISNELGKLAGQIDKFKEQKDSINEPVIFKVPQGNAFEAIRVDAFNAISTAVRTVGKPYGPTSIPQYEIEKNIKWDVLSREIVDLASAKVESAVFQQTLSAELGKRDKAERTFTEFAAAVGDLRGSWDILEKQYQEMSRRYRSASMIVGTYRGAWFLRLWVFDLGFPVSIFLVAQLFFAMPVAWLAWVKQFLISIF